MEREVKPFLNPKVLYPFRKWGECSPVSSLYSNKHINHVTPGVFFQIDNRQEFCFRSIIIDSKATTSPERRCSQYLISKANVPIQIRLYYHSNFFKLLMVLLLHHSYEYFLLLLFIIIYNCIFYFAFFFSLTLLLLILLKHTRSLCAFLLLELHS